MATRPAVCCALIALGASTAMAQVPRSLGEVRSVFPHEFGMVSGLQEMADGRLLVSDPLGQVLMVVDLRTGTADTIGRVGSGPEEYRQPDALYRLPGDSVLMTDLGNGRLTVIAPGGAFVETMSMTRPGPAPASGRQRAGPGDGPLRGGMSFVIPQAVDARGRIYFGMGLGIGSDSGKVGRWDRAADRIDTVATIKLQDVRQQRSGGPDNQRVHVSPVPLSPQDDWAVAPDGRVAVVRSGDYHVEWIDAGGRVTVGSPVVYRPVRVRNAEKQRWLDAGSRGLSIGVTVENGVRQTTFGRGGSRGTPAMDQFEWPDVLPAFVPNRARVAPDGTLWVERYVAAGENTQFDLFDGQGRHIGSVTAPPSRRLAGFGNDAVYLVARDELDLEYLEQYRLARS